MNNTNRSHTAVRPWFAEPMIWMVIAIPLSAVFVGALMMTMAIQSYDGLVVDDYYKHGKEINRVLTRNENALSHDLIAKVKISEDSKLVVDLQHQDGFIEPQQIEMHFLHRTRSGRDQSSELVRYADGLYRGDLPGAIEGVWHVQLETPSWRITGSVSLPDVNEFQIEAK